MMKIDKQKGMVWVDHIMTRVKENLVYCLMSMPNSGVVIFQHRKTFDLMGDEYIQYVNHCKKDDSTSVLPNDDDGVQCMFLLIFYFSIM